MLFIYSTIHCSSNSKAQLIAYKILWLGETHEYPRVSGFCVSTTGTALTMERRTHERTKRKAETPGVRVRITRQVFPVIRLQSHDSQRTRVLSFYSCSPSSSHSSRRRTRWIFVLVVAVVFGLADRVPQTSRRDGKLARPPPHHPVLLRFSFRFLFLTFSFFFSTFYKFLRREL